MTIYRGYEITKSDAGYTWQNAEAGFFAGYFRTEDQAMDAIDAARRAARAAKESNDPR